MFLMRKHIFLTKNVTLTRHGSLSQMLTKSISPDLYNQCNGIPMRQDILDLLELHRDAIWVQSRLNMTTKKYLRVKKRLVKTNGGE